MAKTISQAGEEVLKHLIEGVAQVAPLVQWVIVDRNITKVKLFSDKHRAMAELVRLGPHWHAHRIKIGNHAPVQKRYRQQ